MLYYQCSVLQERRERHDTKWMVRVFLVVYFGFQVFCYTKLRQRKEIMAQFVCAFFNDIQTG